MGPGGSQRESLRLVASSGLTGRFPTIMFLTGTEEDNGARAASSETSGHPSMRRVPRPAPSPMQPVTTLHFGHMPACADGDNRSWPLPHRGTLIFIFSPSCILSLKAFTVIIWHFKTVTDWSSCLLFRLIRCRLHCQFESGGHKLNFITRLS